MAKHHYLQFIVRGDDKELTFPVEEKTCTRLQHILDADTSPRPQFFWFDTLSARSVVMNLEDVQGVRYLWEAWPYVHEEPPEGEAEASVLKLRGRAPLPLGVLEDGNEMQLFCSILETDPEAQPFPAFVDADGELFQVRASDVVWLDVPSSLVADSGGDDLESEVVSPTPKPSAATKKDSSRPARKLVAADPVRWLRDNS
ncbi:hypothetical protein C8238_08395 [Paracidovorax avenae]|uniref:hypothetical protein n=1 Tax=Paracidovorax avenae TaxID=80867 RepID=UPI000D155B95|nr:hypothetical protein [Paracidovorax avenae]AVS88248.1 hypothetical protein C8238_08395 [Paracidovorax avenae]